jgi:hypothetical protein
VRTQASAAASRTSSDWRDSRWRTRPSRRRDQPTRHLGQIAQGDLVARRHSWDVLRDRVIQRHLALINQQKQSVGSVAPPRFLAFGKFVCRPLLSHQFADLYMRKCAAAMSSTRATIPTAKRDQMNRRDEIYRMGEGRRVIKCGRIKRL